MGQVVTDAEPHLYQPPGLTFDTAGVIIEGVLPTHPPVMAGARVTTKVYRRHFNFVKSFVLDSLSYT